MLPFAIDLRSYTLVIIGCFLYFIFWKKNLKGLFGFHNNDNQQGFLEAILSNQK